MKTKEKKVSKIVCAYRVTAATIKLLCSILIVPYIIVRNYVFLIRHRKKYYEQQKQSYERFYSKDSSYFNFLAEMVKNGR